MDQPHDNRRRRARDAGNSAVELAVALAVIGVVTLAIGIGLRVLITDSETTACMAEQRDVAQAVETWFATNSSDTVPPIGDGPDRYERTLVEAGLMRTPSVHLELADDGSISPVDNSPCAPDDDTQMTASETVE
ncbi:MAG: type II secretion system protein [Ilumatobacteraceae bacterium]